VIIESRPWLRGAAMNISDTVDAVLDHLRDQDFPTKLADRLEP